MHWTRRILIAISLAVALLGVAIILLFTIDLGRFKGNLEDYVSEVSGRQFVIGGRFEPSIGETIELVAEDVRLANADWGTAENILELQRVVVSIDTWSLLSGPIEVLNLEVEGLTLHVEKDPETQRSSWSFGDAPAVPDDDESRKPFELPLWLRQARLQRINVIYGRGWLDTPRSVSVSDAKLAADESDLLRMDLSGALGDLPISAEGFVGPLQALLDGRGPRWELDVTVGHFIATTEGSFRDLFSAEGPQIHALMQGPLAERVLAVFGLPPLARGPVDVTADLTESSEGIDLRVEGAFGDLTTDIVGRTESLRTIGTGNLALDVRGPNLQAIGKLFGADFLPATAFAIDGGLAKSGDSLSLQSVVVSAGDTRLEVDGSLASAEVDPDAQVTLLASGNQIRDFLPVAIAEHVPSGAFNVRAIVDGGLQRPALRNLNAKLGGHELTLDGTLPVPANIATLDLAVAAKGPDFDQIVGPWAERDISAESYSVSARIRNNGAGFVVDDLTFELGATSVEFAGTLGTLPTFKGLNGSLTLSGENLQAVMEPWLDIDLPAVAFGVDGKLIASNGAIELSGVTYRLGEAQGELNGTTGVLPSLDGLELNTSFAGPDASQFLELFGDLEDDALVPAEAFETHSMISKTSAGWFVRPWVLQMGESRLEMSGALGDFDGAAGIDIDFAMSGPDLRRFLADRGIESPVPFDIDGGMRVGDDAIEFKEVDVRLGQSSAWFDGRLPTGTELINAEFDVRIAGPNLGRAAQAFDIQDLPAEAYRFEGSMQRSGQSYTVDNLIAVVGENDLNGKLSVDIGPKIRLTGRLESENLNVTKLLRRDDEVPEPPKDEVTDDRLIPDTALPLQILDIADVDLTLRMKHLETGYSNVGDVELKLVIENDELHLDTKRVSLVHGGTLAATFDLVRTGEETAAIEANAVARQIRLRPSTDADGNPVNRPPQDLNLQLAANGATFRELAATANGLIDLRVGKGQIDNDFQGFLMRDFIKQLSSAINPLSKKSKYTQANCGFLNVGIVGGIATSRAIGLQTDELAIASVGTLNLATEELDLSFRVKQREGVGVSLAGVINPYIKVGGTLAAPALRIDAKRGLVSGTFAVLTGGLSILAKGAWDRYLSRDDYCEAVIEALESGEIPVWQGGENGS